MTSDSRILVAGHRGMVGSAIVRRLEAEGFRNLLLFGREVMDLTDAGRVRAVFAETRPEYVFLAAAKVGGILANDSSPVDFLRDNLSIELSVIQAAHETGVRKLMFFGSSCVYPRHAPQPIREESLLTGPLEPTNEWYAVAKIAGIKLCQAYRKQFGDDFISVMPTNLYGPNDNFDLATGHVLPALIRRFSEARAAHSPEVVLWGTGTPRREFLHVDDLADAALALMRRYSDRELVNVGTGQDLTIAELASMVARITGYAGRVVWDATKPDGTPRKLLDVTRLSHLGWRPRIGLEEGIAETVAWYRQRGPQGPASHAGP